MLFYLWPVIRIYENLIFIYDLQIAAASGSWCGAERQRCGPSGSG